MWLEELMDATMMSEDGEEEGKEEEEEGETEETEDPY